MRRSSIILLPLLLLLAACQAPTSSSTAIESRDVATTPPRAVASTTTTTTTASEPLSPLSPRTTSLGSAIYDEREHESAGPSPTSISIPSIGVSDAGVVDVGVADNGDMEIPGADAVGWYRFNPNPGEPGSAVLAAHISFDGRPGVFRYLNDASVGDVVSVGFDDGSERSFEIVELAQYSKGDLPKDRVFAKSGDPVLTLITCGGDFNRELRSYEDNIVAYAIPITPSQNAG